MLTGGSVGVGWDQLQRTGPKDDRQVTRFKPGCLTFIKTTNGVLVWRVIINKNISDLTPSVRSTGRVCVCNSTSNNSCSSPSSCCKDSEVVLQLCKSCRVCRIPCELLV
jgi:hypothetical protein